MSDEPNDRENFDVSGHIQDRDMDNNGIPDFQQNHLNGSPDNPYYGPGAEARNDASRGYQSYDAGGSPTGGSTSSGGGDQSQESDRTDRADYGPNAASDSPYSRATREAMGHASSTYSSAKPGQDERAERTETADKANEKVRDKERKSESNVDRALDDDKYRQALNDLEVRRLRERPRKESRLSEEIKKASQQHRTDDKDGLALGKAIISGLKGGLKHESQRAKEKKTDRDNQNADKVMLEFIGGEAQKRRDQIAEAKRIEEEKRQKQAEERAKTQSGSAPGGDGPDGAGPQSPGPGSPNPGPGGDGPGGGGPGGDGPGGGKPADSDRTETPGAAPKEAEAPSPEAPKPANENETVEPLRETGMDRAAERASALHGERERGFGREPGQGAEAEVVVKSEKAETRKPEVDPKSAARDAASPVSSNVSPGEANASAGAGMIMAAVNPPLGIAATAAKSRHAQVEAGAEHVDLRKAAPDKKLPQSKGPEASSVSVSVPARGAAPHASSPVQGRIQPERRLETPSSDNVVEFRRPQRPDRPGGIRAQAGNLPPSRRPDVSSRGEEVAQPRTRIMGVGSALSRFIEQDVRGPGGKGQNRGDDAIAATMAGRGQGR